MLKIGKKRRNVISVGWGEEGGNKASTSTLKKNVLRCLLAAIFHSQGLVCTVFTGAEKNKNW